MSQDEMKKDKVEPDAELSNEALDAVAGGTDNGEDTSCPNCGQTGGHAEDCPRGM